MHQLKRHRLAENICMVCTSTYHITLLDPLNCNYIVWLIMFPLWPATVITFYFSPDYWLWKLTNVFLLLWLCNYYSLNTIVSWLVNRKIIEFCITKLKVKVAQSCLTLCNPKDYSVHGILQATILEWVAFPFSIGSPQRISHIAGDSYQLSHKGTPRILEWVAYPFSSGSSWPRNWTGVFRIAGEFFTNWAIREALHITRTTI